ncbi:WD repeat-containing protein 27-like isoform X2 [Apostichopus japonicus]|uniref:WD repeat-containing protein 27-like isoform X2 n=1 Tax=Stichopus japonicus TaxID=307972 RepID=UPI003AB67A45
MKMSQTNQFLHLRSLPTNCSSSLTQFGCNGIYLAAPLSKINVGIWSLQSLESKPLELVAHRKSPSSISFGKCFGPTSLCTAADDYVIVWNVEKARSMFENGQQIRGQIVGRNLGTVQYTSFSPDDALLALCIEQEIHIFNIQTQELHTLLEGHTSLVTCAEFCEHQADVIITSSEDRTFKIWDLHSSSLIYESSIISAYPFLSLAIDPYMEVIALGSSDGQIRVYDIRDGGGYKLLHQLDAGKFIEKKLAKRKEAINTAVSPATISSRPSWHRTAQAEDDDPLHEDSASSHAGEAILSVWFHQSPAVKDKKVKKSAFNDNNLFKPDDGLVDNLISDSSFLLVGTSGTISVIHTKSFEGDVFSFQDTIQTLGAPEDNKLIPVAGSFAFASSPDLRKAICVSLSAFQNSVEVIEVTFPSNHSQESLNNEFSEKLSMKLEPPSTEEGITVVASTPLLESSILRSEMIPRTGGGGRGGGGATSSKQKPAVRKPNQKGVQDQPLTFQKKIKSSGYTSAPRVKMFSPKTGHGKTTSVTRTKPHSTGGTKSILKEFPMNSDPPSALKQSLKITDQPAPLLDLKFSGDGQFLACALGDKSGQVLKMPLTGKGTCLTGHNGPLNTISWSHDNAWLITSSADKTAKVWMKGSADPILTLSHLKHNIQNNDVSLPARGPGSIKKDNPCFTKEIKHSQFYYLDKFIILSSGGSFYLYKFSLDTSVNDIKRYVSKSSYKLVKQFKMEEANLVTSLSAANSFYSYIVLCCGSDKSIELFDLNAGCRLSKIEEGHSRPVNHITQNLGSNYASLSPSACNLFATSAATDGIKVWDVRTNRCVRKLGGHLNRAHSCGITFSPCGQYLVSGSEDKAAYVFDLKEGSVVEKLTGHTDVVTGVAYHPLYPEVVTGTLDGNIQLFSNR